MFEQSPSLHAPPAQTTLCEVLHVYTVTFSAAA